MAPLEQPISDADALYLELATVRDLPWQFVQITVLGLTPFRPWTYRKTFSVTASGWEGSGRLKKSFVRSRLDHRAHVEAFSSCFISHEGNMHSS